MFLPIGDSPNLPKTPWMTWALIAVNVAIHLSLVPLGWQAPDPYDPTVQEYARVLIEERGVPPQALQLSAADVVRYEYGFKPSEMSLVDAFTAMFLHGGLMHLFGNMLFLWIYGDNVEHRLGRFTFLLAYLGTGFASALGDAALRWGSAIPSVGASGAISGILGFYFLFFPRNRVRVFIFLFPFFMNVVELPARIVLGVYLVIDNLLPLLLTGGAGGVSHGAHIGGFAAGVALAWGFGNASLRGQQPRRSERPGAAPHTIQERFHEALLDGRLGEASALLFDLPRAHTRLGLGPGEKIALGEKLIAAGDAQGALRAFQRALADHPTGPGRARAHLGAARVLLEAFASPTAAYQHLYAAMEENPTPEDVARARTLEAALRGAARSVPRHRPW